MSNCPKSSDGHHEYGDAGDPRQTDIEMVEIPMTCELCGQDASKIFEFSHVEEQ